MKGHEPILEMRKKRMQPEWVFINDFPSPDSVDWHLFDDFATVCVDGDNIRMLDMRFLIDCKVSITSTNERRAKQLFNECKKYALLVASGVVNPNEHPTKQTGWNELWQR